LTESNSPSSAGPLPNGFALKSGARIQYGPRTGKVEEVRGGGPEPYEVKIRWEGSKYPEWALFASLRGFYQQGELKIVEQGKGTLFERLKTLFASK
jgi:hypothetical protein